MARPRYNRDAYSKKELAGADRPAAQRLQMHVSRLRTHALGYLRSRLLNLEGTRADAGPALAPQPPAGRASATSANRLYGGRRGWSYVRLRYFVTLAGTAASGRPTSHPGARVRRAVGTKPAAATSASSASTY